MMDYGTIVMLVACCATAVWAEWRYQKTLTLEREINCRYQWPEDEERPPVRRSNILESWLKMVTQEYSLAVVKIFTMATYCDS